MNIDFSNLDNNSAMSLDISDRAEYEVEPGKLLELAVQKLRYGGVLSITGVDYLELCRLAMLGRVTQNEFNEVIRERKAILSIEGVLEIMQSLGLSPLEKSLYGYTYRIKFERKLNVNR